MIQLIGRLATFASCTLPWLNWAAFSLLAGMAMVAAIMAVGILVLRLMST